MCSSDLELAGINYDDANALITELILFIEDVDAENHETYQRHFNEIIRILNFAIAA